jgi:hypothetical protein
MGILSLDLVFYKAAPLQSKSEAVPMTQQHSKMNDAKEINKAKLL